MVRTFSEVAQEALGVCKCAYIGSGTRYVLEVMLGLNTADPNTPVQGSDARTLVNCFLDLTETRWTGTEADRIKDELLAMVE